MLRHAREGVYLQAVRFQNGPPRAAEGRTIGARGKVRFEWWWLSRVHDPVCRAGGAIFPIYTHVICGGRSVSNCVTKCLAAASARSLPLILVLTLILWRVVRRPTDLLVSRRLVMLPRSSFMVVMAVVVL
jgi:hypothetical protein